MFSKVKKWLPKFRHLILRVVLTLICSIAVGVGYSLIISDQYLPTMDGNVYAMDPTGNSLFMVLSKEANNSLVHIDYSGSEMDGEVCLKVDVRKSKDAARLHEMLCSWQQAAAMLEAGEISKEDYDKWRYLFASPSASAAHHPHNPASPWSPRSSQSYLPQAAFWCGGQSGRRRHIGQ